MHGFNNTLEFLVGDDVPGSPNKTSAFIRAAVRDMKSYIASKICKSISVGYATSDNGWTNGIAKYLACVNPNTAIDFLNINNREWCESNNYDTSRYKAMASAYSLYPVPTFLAAYGCLSSGSGAIDRSPEIAYDCCNSLVASSTISSQSMSPLLMVRRVVGRYEITVSTEI